MKRFATMVRHHSVTTTAPSNLSSAVLSVRGGAVLRRRSLLRLSAWMLPMAFDGCAGPVRGPAVPLAKTERATVLDGLSNARFLADTQIPQMTQEWLDSLERERKHLGLGATDPLPPANLLAISAGTDNGAFGAGLLVGWSAAGNRPNFKLVTGASTGALIAPFAFLGSAYDSELREVYTGISKSDIIDLRSYLAILFEDAIGDTRPLTSLIAHYADERMLASIAQEYANGRLLLITSANLDAMRPIIWNIGAIAASGHPGALDLFRRILLAAVSVPAVFTPTLIDVEVDGQQYQEMHVDGGTVTQLFLYPPAITAGHDLRRGPLARERRAYVIRNARIDPEWEAVHRRVLPIAGRTINSLLYFNSYLDILRLQANAARDGIDFNLAYIDSGFTMERTDFFDQKYMRALFDYAYEQARRGYPWRKEFPLTAERAAGP